MERETIKQVEAHIYDLAEIHTMRNWRRPPSLPEKSITDKKEILQYNKLLQQTWPSSRFLRTQEYMSMPRGRAVATQLTRAFIAT